MIINNEKYTEFVKKYKNIYSYWYIGFNHYREYIHEFTSERW